MRYESSFNHLGIDDWARQRRITPGIDLSHLALHGIAKAAREAGGGVVIALSSSNPGEGVTYVARALLHELAKCELTSVAGVNVSFLQQTARTNCRSDPKVDIERQARGRAEKARTTESLDKIFGDVAAQRARGRQAGNTGAIASSCCARSSITRLSIALRWESPEIC